MRGNRSSMVRYGKIRAAAAAYVLDAKVPGHTVRARQDTGDFFWSEREPPGWKAYCECGWRSAGFLKGEIEALASAERHLKSNGEKA